MHILLISIAYPPEIRSASQLTKEFSHELVAQGHQVTVLTGQPHYNLSEKSKGTKYSVCSFEEGVQVVRLKTLPVHKIPLLLRGVTELLLPFMFFFQAKKSYINMPVDVIEVYSPPLTLGIAGWMLKRRFRAPLVVNVQDLFPQNAVDLGLIKNNVVLKVFRFIESFVYKFSDLITVHSKGNKTFLLNYRKQPESKVKVIHNWVDDVPFKKVTRTGKFRRQYDLENKFILLFAGVLGPAQGMDIIINTCIELAHNTEIVFLLVGDGTDKERLVKKVEKHGLKNVRFEHFISMDDYPALVKDCDVGLLSISPLYHTPVVPGKLLGYMAGEIPIIASLNKESDGHDIIKKSGAGISIVGNDIYGFKDAVLFFYNNRKKCIEMGKNGSQYVRRYFRKEHCVSMYMDLFKQLIR